MEGNRVFTRQRMGLDKRVWFAMFATIILSLGILSYRYDKDCVPVEFTFKSFLHSKGNSFATGERISFNASASDVTWSFGDQTKEQKGQHVYHIFQTEGDYEIIAYTQSSCEPVTAQITIKKPAPREDNKDIFTGEPIEGPASAISGKNVGFTCKVPANFYEWSIINIPKSTKVGSSVTFSFPGSGTYTIQVTLNNDLSRRYTKEVSVEDDDKAVTEPKIKPNSEIKRLDPLDDYVPPMPEVTKEAPPKPIEPETTVVRGPLRIADDLFKSYLALIVNGSMKVQDFEKYGIVASTPVKANDKKNMDFTTLCNELTKKKGGGPLNIFKQKSVKLESAQLQRINGVVTIIDVKYHW